ncbi:hypothetical protein [Pseudonocardia lacus]|uniref:hypothetical protein n=1 Tax=Pseudonocardia lacus TaxID=2835865 RepID=UPI001BDDBD32|nr:hypothetical protein [Pseudonocardia lacus]
MPAFRAMSAGCGGFTPDHDLPCDREVTATGLWFSSYRSTAWQAFACEHHAHLLIAPRRLFPRDHDTLLRRHQRAHGQHTGDRYAGEHDGPLARGAQAGRLVARAEAWAARHPLKPSND